MSTENSVSTSAGPRLLWNFGATLARYKDVAGWLLRDAYFRFRRDFIAVLMLSGASLGLQFAALGVIYYYLRAVESEAPVDIVGRTFEPQASFPLLLMAAAAVLLLFGGGIVLGYLGRVRALTLSRAYEEFCSKRAIALVNERAKPNIGIPERRAIHRESRVCGIVARILINAVVPALFVIVATGILLYTDPTVTLWLGLLVAMAAPLLYWVSVRGARFTQLMERTSARAALAKRTLVSKDHGTRPTAVDDPELERAFAGGPLKKNLDAYVGRRRAVEESGLVTGLLMAAALVLILAQQGGQILVTGKGLSSLAIYLITLRIQLTNLSKTMRVLTSVNRFYPQIARHRRFLLGIPGDETEAVEGILDDEEDLDALE